MNKYIGCKMVSAEPAFQLDGVIHPIEDMQLLFEHEKEKAKVGYKIEYPDGYISWSPKDVFEKAYMKLEDNKELPSGVSIGEKMINEFIAIVDTKTMGDRTTVVMCTQDEDSLSPNPHLVWILQTIHRRLEKKFAWVKSKIKFGNFLGSCYRLLLMELIISPENS